MGLGNLDELQECFGSSGAEIQTKAEESLPGPEPEIVLKWSRKSLEHTFSRCFSRLFLDPGPGRLFSVFFYVWGPGARETPVAPQGVAKNGPPQRRVWVNIAFGMLCKLLKSMKTKLPNPRTYFSWKFLRALSESLTTGSRDWLRNPSDFVCYVVVMQCVLLVVTVWLISV